MDNTFVRQDFYIDPPSRNASPEEWKAWQKADDKKAATAKMMYTKSFDQQEAPAWLVGETITTVGKGGVHRQSTLVGFTGSSEEGSCRAEAAVDAKQEHHIALVHMEGERNKRGSKGTRKGKNARRRANRKAKLELVK